MLQSITMFKGKLKMLESEQKKKLLLKHSFSLICTSISGRVFLALEKMFMVLQYRHEATYTLELKMIDWLSTGGKYVAKTTS